MNGKALLLKNLYFTVTRLLKYVCGTYMKNKLFGKFFFF